MGIGRYGAKLGKDGLVTRSTQPSTGPAGPRMTLASPSKRKSRFAKRLILDSLQNAGLTQVFAIMGGGTFLLQAFEAKRE
jgi:hypothetical protein